jgi:ADP-ribosylglycohydrolase
MNSHDAGRQDRAVGALLGLAIGDALGMPTQSFSPDEIDRRFGRLTGFIEGPSDQPLAPGMPAGSVTDDTEQAVLLADLLLEGHGRVDPVALAHRLMAWEERMRARGSLDLLGPSTTRAIAAVRAGGAVDAAGRFGATNGAAMRIAPVGIAVDVRLPDRLERAVYEASIVTHNTGVALAGAAAVAAAVSAGVNGGDVRDAISAAVTAAARARRLGHWVAGADVSRRIAWAVEVVEGQSPTAATQTIRALVGTSLATQESVPAAFATLATHPDDPWEVVLMAASLGGDCDTIAAIAGTVAGATHGTKGFPEFARRLVQDVNGLDLPKLASRLLSLRDSVEG